MEAAVEATGGLGAPMRSEHDCDVAHRRTNDAQTKGVCVKLGVVLSVAAGCILLSIATVLRKYPATCASLECPQHYVAKVSAMNASCVGTVCSPATDLDVCCARTATCSSMACPPLHVQRESRTHVACAAATCSLEKDLGSCCEPVAVCASMQCPSLHIPKGNGSRSACAGATCTLAKDTKSCCDQAAACSSIECPPEYVLKESPGRVPCLGRTCTIENDLGRCCEKAPSVLGSFMACPSCQVASGLVSLSRFWAKLPGDRSSERDFQCKQWFCKQWF